MQLRETHLRLFTALARTPADFWGEKRSISRQEAAAHDIQGCASVLVPASPGSAAAYQHTDPVLTHAHSARPGPPPLRHSPEEQ